MTFTMVSGKEYIKTITPAMAEAAGRTYSEVIETATDMCMNLPMTTHVVIDPDTRDILSPAGPTYLNPINIESVTITDIQENAL